jgi:hypothetical protein
MRAIVTLIAAGVGFSMINAMLVDRLGYLLTAGGWFAFGVCVVIVAIRIALESSSDVRRRKAPLLTGLAALIALLIWLSPALGRVGMLIDAAMLRSELAGVSTILGEPGNDRSAEVRGRFPQVNYGPPIRVFHQTSSSFNDVAFGYVYDPSHVIAPGNWAQEQDEPRPPREVSNFSGYEPIACRHAFREVYRCQMV